MNDDLECPYCGNGCKVDHDDGQGYDEDKYHEMECPHCGKNFVFTTSVVYYYHPQKADCLNGEPHKFTEWRTLGSNDKGDSLQRCRCTDCGEVKERVIRK
jgi:DNA-directed RNA polymerase subunit RPC12/RpoP